MQMIGWLNTPVVPVGLLLLGVGAGWFASVDASAGEDTLQRQFISCPVYRDTDAGPKSGCWLAIQRETGERFDITGALVKPQLGKAVLVEGVIAEGEPPPDPDQCGATILEPIRVSILEEPCPEHILPAETYTGRRFSLPAEVMQPLTVPRELPEGPYTNKTFTLLFNFNASFLNYQYSEIILEKLALYIKASNPAAVEVTGYAATAPYKVSGQELREPLQLAEARARQVGLALSRLVPEYANISLSWQGEPNTINHYAGGLPEETKRRVTIQVRVE